MKKSDGAMRFRYGVSCKWITRLRRMRNAAFTPLQRAKRKQAAYFQRPLTADGEAKPAPRYSFPRASIVGAFDVIHEPTGRIRRGSCVEERVGCAVGRPMQGGRSVDVVFLHVRVVFIVVGGMVRADDCDGNDVLTVASPSLTVTVIVATPTFLRVGVTVTVRFAAEPPNLMLQAGTRVGLLDVAETVRLPGLLSMSPTVKAIGPVDEFFAIV